MDNFFANIYQWKKNGQQVIQLCLQYISLYHSVDLGKGWFSWKM